VDFSLLPFGTSIPRNAWEDHKRYGKRAAASVAEVLQGRGWFSSARHYGEGGERQGDQG